MAANITKKHDIIYEGIAEEYHGRYTKVKLFDPFTGYRWEHYTFYKLQIMKIVPKRYYFSNTVKEIMKNTKIHKDTKFSIYGSNIHKEVIMTVLCGECGGNYTQSANLLKKGILKCKCRLKGRNLLYGFGIKDIETPCDSDKYYSKWCGIIRRCYSVSERHKFRAYTGCTVSDKWRLFSNFKSWCILQEDAYGIDIADYNIDKDLKSLRTKGDIYSEELCTFITPQINSFMTDNLINRGEWPLGVHKRTDGKFYSQCKDPFQRYSNGKTKVIHLGVFSNPIDAHITWAEKKLEFAIKLTNCPINNVNNILGDYLIITYHKILEEARRLK